MNKKEWKEIMAKNLDRELEARGISNSERARSAYWHYRNNLFGWIRDMAEEVKKISQNPGAVLIVEEEDSLMISIGTEMLRLRSRPYPLCARGWGKIIFTGTNPLPFYEVYLWSKGDTFVWVYGDILEINKSKNNEFLHPGIEATREKVEELFQAAFKKYLNN